jgi:hypothetical protein
MTTRVGTVKRRSWRAASVIALSLVGLAILTRPPFGLRILTSSHTRPSAVNFAIPTAQYVPSTKPEAAPIVGGAALDARAAAPKTPNAEKSTAASVELAPLTARRVLTGVTQLALAIPESSTASSVQPPAESAESRILREHFARLKTGREQFSHRPGYTATMVKQERVGLSLLDEGTFGIKVRHQPFSVYMRWQSGDETGKEVLYVGGTTEDQLLVHLGGLKGRILPAIKIDPFGSLALQHSRYPITKLGIVALADSLIERRELEMRENVTVHVEQRQDADCEGRPCSVYVFEDADQSQSPIYRKSVQYIDRQWNVPLRVANYTWPEPGQHLQGAALDEATLIEYYMYSEIVTDAHLTDADFDRANDEYHFHR